MSQIQRLPETEFEVMKVIWENEEPITANIIMEHLGNEKNWKIQTVISLLNRLVKRGFLRTDKPARERNYYSLVEKDSYLAFETKNFVSQYHNNSFTKLVNSLFYDRKLTDEDLDELIRLAKERRE